MKDRYIITGGAGFIGTNLANRYLAAGKSITIFDNFSRAGSEHNVKWLQDRYGERLTVLRGDVREPNREFFDAIENADVVFHLAGQVAVTTSVTNPRHDFEINALGTFNVLEAVRASSSRPIVLYSSTNKVYGKMSDIEVAENNGRYEYRHEALGIPESRPLDFYSPYGCSKGAGDQYAIDYARIYGLRTIVFRQSCIYGPRQFGVEDQGWVAWFAICALRNMPITIFGDGKQVRDVLYVDDLITAYDRAIQNIETTAGRAYNIGGGPRNTLSLLELIRVIERRLGRSLPHSFDAWRPGDQLVFISDIGKAEADFGWKPAVSVSQGINALLDWLVENRNLFDKETSGERLAEGAIAR